MAEPRQLDLVCIKVYSWIFHWKFKFSMAGSVNSSVLLYRHLILLKPFWIVTEAIILIGNSSLKTFVLQPQLLNGLKVIVILIQFWKGVHSVCRFGSYWLKTSTFQTSNSFSKYNAKLRCYGKRILRNLQYSQMG